MRSKDDFNQWWRYHTTLYPGIVKWLAGFPTAATALDHETTQSFIRESWHTDLYRFTLEECRQASESMHRRGVKKAFGDHPRTIAAICREGNQDTSNKLPQPCYIGGEWRHDCNRCFNIWTLTIWHPLTIRKVGELLKEGATPQYNGDGLRAICAVACDCEHAQRRNDRLKSKLLVYEESHPLMLITDQSEESFHELVAAVEAAMSVQHAPNYEPSFENWNQN